MAFRSGSSNEQESACLKQPPIALMISSHSWSFSVTESWLKMRSRLPLPQGVDGWTCTHGGHEEFFHCRMQTTTRLNVPELCTLATTLLHQCMEPSKLHRLSSSSSVLNSTVPQSQLKPAATRTAHEARPTQLSSHLEQQSQEHTGFKESFRAQAFGEKV